VVMPDGVGIIDTMIGFPMRDKSETYAFINRQVRDRESQEEFSFPAQYMFKDVPDEAAADDDPVELTLREMDRFGIEMGLVGVSADGEGDGARAVRRHPDRFIPGGRVDPNEGVDAVRQIRRAHETFGIRSVDVFPAGCSPPVPIDDRKMYPIYSTCVELGISVWVCAGVPGPRLPMASQRVELIDEVMYDFPELVFVTRHGCEPWTDLAVKLMLKWPGLHYCTSAFAPKHYPRAIIDYANTRGADKVIYAGYFPMGLTLDRIMGDMVHVPFADHVWPKFLRGNAARVLGLEG